MLTRRLILNSFLLPIVAAGLAALPIISIVALLVGAGIVAETGIELPKLGIQNLMGAIVLHVIFGIVGPFATALIVTARSTSGLAVEIGNMRVTGELDTIEMLGVNLSNFLVTPRLVGIVISNIALTFYFGLIAMTGGFAMALMGLSMPIATLVRMIETSIKLSDLVLPFLEGLGYGLIISSVSVYHGLRVKNSPVDVPRETTLSLVSSLSLCTVMLSLYLIFSSLA
ncbi:MAG: ABC transporter permease [Nitrospiraceae bacterium]|nr:ABC transporter permease [Nitrospiraceae bacterium]